MRVRRIRCLAVLGVAALLQCLLPAVCLAAVTAETNGKETLTEVVVTGTRLVLTLMHELRRAKKRYGIASACIGGGQGIAILIENPAA